MEASLMPYCQGAIALYNPPYDEAILSKYNLFGKHPVMIATKHFTETTFEYMCFPITSKIEKFCGYRILLNNTGAGPLAGKMSVIRTDVMQCIDRRHLYSIFGYAPPALVERCLMAYAWHMGLSDEVPEYVTEDLRRMEYYLAGETNVAHNPTRIEGDIACHGFRADPETGAPILFHAREFVPKGMEPLLKPCVSTKPITRTVAPPKLVTFTEGSPADTTETSQGSGMTNVGLAMLDAAKKLVAEHEAKEETPAAGGTEAAAAAEETTPKPTPKKKGVELDMPLTIREEMDAVILPAPINTGSSATTVQRYLNRSRNRLKDEDINLTKEMIDRIKAIPIKSRKLIYAGAMSEVEMRSKLKMSRYTAHKMRMAIIKYITTGIERLGQDMKKFQKDCKFLLNDEEILFLTCMLPYEMRYSRVGLDFYRELLPSKYDINYEKDTICGMVEAELKRLGKEMPNF